MTRGGGVQEVIMALRAGIEARGHQAFISHAFRSSCLGVPRLGCDDKSLVTAGLDASAQSHNNFLYAPATGHIVWTN